MRVIAGTARGMRLEAPKGLQVRPTLDQVREALFNILAPRIPGARFLDLYAGSGANGIEALSRGAASCTLVEKDAGNLAIIRKNLEKTRLAGAADCMRLILPEGLRHLAGKEAYDVIFADPPYKAVDFSALLESMAVAGLLVEGGVIVIEHASDTEPPERAGGFLLDRKAKYGKTTLSFFLDASDGIC